MLTRAARASPAACTSSASMARRRSSRKSSLLPPATKLPLPLHRFDEALRLQFGVGALRGDQLMRRSLASARMEGSCCPSLSSPVRTRALHLRDYLLVDGLVAAFEMMMSKMLPFQVLVRCSRWLSARERHRVAAPSSGRWLSDARCAAAQTMTRERSGVTARPAGARRRPALRPPEDAGTFPASSASGIPRAASSRLPCIVCMPDMHTIITRHTTVKGNFR